MPSIGFPKKSTKKTKNQLSLFLKKATKTKTHFSLSSHFISSNEFTTKDSSFEIEVKYFFLYDLRPKHFSSSDNSATSHLHQPSQVIETHMKKRWGEVKVIGDFDWCNTLLSTLLVEVPTEVSFLPTTITLFVVHRCFILFSIELYFFALSSIHERYVACWSSI